MVLQRDAPVPVWGQASPGEKITVSIAQVKRQTKADKQGNWSVTLPPHSAGGPFELLVTGDNTLRFEDVLYGEVWLCSGQSNMNYTLEMLGIKETDSARVNNPLLRLFTVGLAMDYQPRQDVASGQWERAGPEKIHRFSAAAWYFGLYLQDKLQVPVGLIHSSMGATAIETWMSTGALRQFPQFQPLVAEMEKTGKNFAQLQAELKLFRQSWDEQYYLKGDPGIIHQWQNPDLDDTDWNTMNLPALWEDNGLADYDGSVWFRKQFSIPAGFQDDSLRISLNQIDDYDIVWVNGTRIGEGFGNRNWRSYNCPASLLKPEGNVIAVRVFDAGGKGGMYTNPFWGNPILNGTWKYRPGVRINAADFPRPTVPNGSLFTHPSLLFNGSIAPLAPFAIRGVIWYQGESNAARAEEYRELLPAMITDWRQYWKQGDFPFLVVQLANFYPEQVQPAESSWAELREAQSLALQLPNTALATAIDIGDANDIHPRDKAGVGQRLGLGALKIAYGMEVVHSGPVFKSIRTDGDKAIIHFDLQGSTLVSRDKHGYLRGFAMAGADRKFYWARAFIEEDKVVVRCPQVPLPVAVRYAWADNPGQLDLYNNEGLPALPFRTDDWPLTTKGLVFTYDENGF
jgi:sialate O-acetylesterase